MKKNLIVLLAAVTFSGCLNYYQETILKKDGSGEMFVHYWTKVSSAQDSLLLEQFGLFNEDSIASAFASPYLNIDNVESYYVRSDSAYHGKIEFSFQSLDSLNHTQAFKYANFQFIDGAPEQKVFSQNIAPFASGFGFNSVNYDLTYIYYLPGNIISHNADEVSSNKLTWRFKSGDIRTGKTITATIRPFRLKETPQWIYILAALVLFVVIVFLFKKNRS